MGIEISFRCTDGQPGLVDSLLDEPGHQNIKVIFTNSSMQELWDHWIELGRISINVSVADPELFEADSALPAEYVYRTKVGIFVQRKRLPGLCRALKLDHSAQIAAALTYMTKRSSKTPDYFKPVAEDAIQDINLTNLLWVAKNPLFQKDFLSIRHTGPVLYHHLDRFIETYRAAKIPN